MLKLTGGHNHGGLTVVEVTMGPGRTAPPHVHHREDEIFLINRGQLTFQIGDQTIERGRATSSSDYATYHTDSPPGCELLA